MNFLALGQAGTVSWYAPARPDAGPTVEIRNADGGAEVAAGTSATLDSVDTTLAEGAPATARTVILSSATGIVVNRRYLISGQNAQSEFCEIERLAGTTAYLKYPLVYDHPDASDFEGTLVSYSISASVLASTRLPEDNWSAIFSYNILSTAQTPGVVAFHLTKHPVVNPVAPIDLFRVEPFLRQNVAVDTDLQDVCTRAFDEVCERLYARNVKPYDVIGSELFRRCVTYCALFLCSEQYGHAYADQQDRLWKRFSDTLDIFQSNAAVDVDQDEKVEAHERRAIGGEWSRA